MQKLRSTFKRSRTPTGAEMKSQSSLEVPKQVRSASFDEIQLGLNSRGSSLESSAELRSIANIAMATSSSLSAAVPTTTTAAASSFSTAAAAFSPTHRSLTVCDYYYAGSTSSIGAGTTTTTTSTGAVRKVTTSLRVPQFQTGQRSKSFDVAERSASLLEHHHHQRSSSSVGTTSGTSPFPAYVARWRSSAERENPPAQAYSCWHCACVDEYLAASRGAVSNDSWDAEDEAEDASTLDDEYDEASTLDDGEEEDDEVERRRQQQEEELLEADDELSAHHRAAGAAGIQLERDAADNSYYFVVVEKTYEDDGRTLDNDDCGSDCSRREGSPEIRVTLTATSSETKTSTDLEADYSFESSCAEQQQPIIRCGELVPASRQRRRSITRQEALTVFPPSELPSSTILAAATATQGQSSPDEDAAEDEEEEEEDDDENEGSAVGCASDAAGLVVRDIFLTVPDLKRDRAASVDSCFNNNKNGKIETGYSLAVPQQSTRSKSVDIVLPTEAQTRYTALLPGSNESRPPFPG